MSEDKEKTATLHIYPDVLQAKMMQDKLKRGGINSFLNDENILGLDPIGGTELRVLEKDKETAEKILHS
ncbi:MAG: DUF2007 domain-containing protein [Bacteroidetes bacterium]|nr:DUF2007 domain-containing protein [Bacteroidota bacterium]